MSPILRYFSSEHLPVPLARVSAPFGELAHRLADSLPPGPETTVALRKLLEAKDAAVRAALDPETTSDPESVQFVVPRDAVR